MSTAKANDPAKILIVDDLEVNVSILENIIVQEGYQALCALNVQEALEIMAHTKPQLILSDYSMPEMDGLAFCKLVKSNPKTKDIPFVFITVFDSPENKKVAFEAGAADYIPKPFERAEVVMRVNNQLNSYRSKLETQEHNRMMHKVISEQRNLVETEQERLLTALVKMIEIRDPWMGGHLERVGYNSRLLAQAYLLTQGDEEDEEFPDIIFAAAKLHDIGAFLYRNEQEGDRADAGFKEEHAEQGANFLEEISRGSSVSRFLEMAAQIARYHHARWDGTGYPKGIGGEGIPLAARITAIANDFDQIYRECAEKEDALTEAIQRISERSGSSYDPQIAAVFGKIRRKLQVP